MDNRVCMVFGSVLEKKLLSLILIEHNGICFNNDYTSECLLHGVSETTTICYVSRSGIGRN